VARGQRHAPFGDLVVGILAVAAGLRFWGLGAGIPYSLGVDEPELMERAVRMMRTGDFHPHFFDYPGFYIYLQLIVACLRFLAGATAGTWTALDQATTADFYLWRRALTASIGTATVLLVYHIACDGVRATRRSRPACSR
jgi:hypothetical protein